MVTRDTAHGRVLVVDDEACVRRAIERVLGGQHEVVGVRDGDEALAAITAEGARFDVMLCDVEIVGMDVTELCRRLAERRPALLARTVFLTAGVLSAAHQQFLATCARPVLDKPFPIDELRALVARELAPRWPALPFAPDELSTPRVIERPRVIVRPRTSGDARSRPKFFCSDS